MEPTYLSPSPSRREIVQEFLRLEVPIEEDWDQIEEEIARAHTEGLPEADVFLYTDLPFGGSASSPRAILSKIRFLTSRIRSRRHSS